MFRNNYTTEMSGNRKSVEKRFTAINANKKRGIITAVSVFAAVLIVSGAVFINGIATDSTDIYSENGDDITTATINPRDSLAMVNPYMPEKNPYNDKYVDISGKTIEDIAQESDMTLEELLAEYDLPADMPADTHENAAYQMIPCKRIAELYGLNGFEELKNTMHFPDFVTEDTPWGEALGETTLRYYIGRDELVEQFKEYYGFGDEVTADTKFKEVHRAVSERERQDRWDAAQSSGKVVNALDNSDGISDIDESAQMYQEMMTD